MPNRLQNEAEVSPPHTMKRVIPVSYTHLDVYKRQVQQYINKQCSVFRGNIGPEFDAMLDALGLNFAPVVLGFPDNGRTTLDGIHYVYGEKLEDSQFRNDPVNPMRESNLVKILAVQTRRPVTNVSWREYAEGRRLRGLIERCV